MAINKSIGNKFLILKFFVKYKEITTRKSLKQTNAVAKGRSFDS